MTKNPFLNALTALAYIAAVASFMFYAGKTLPKQDTFLTPIVALSLLTLSAAVMACVFFYQPFQLYFNGKKKQAIHLVFKTIAVFAGLTIVLLVLLFSGLNLSQKKAPQSNAPATTRNCVADECLQVENLEYPAATLSEEVTTSLKKALDDEYKAQATYDTVISKFGNVRPFIMIVRAEEQHIAALKSLFDKYGISIPENPYVNVSIPETVKQACQTGVDAEIENVRLYREDLLPTVSGYQDITAVFTNLMNASETKHLPAFERCN